MDICFSQLGVRSCSLMPSTSPRTVCDPYDCLHDAATMHLHAFAGSRAGTVVLDPRCDDDGGYGASDDNDRRLTPTTTTTAPAVVTAAAGGGWLPDHANRSPQAAAPNRHSEGEILGYVVRGTTLNVIVSHVPFWYPGVIMAAKPAGSAGSYACRRRLLGRAGFVADASLVRQ